MSEEHGVVGADKAHLARDLGRDRERTGSVRASLCSFTVLTTWKCETNHENVVEVLRQRAVDCRSSSVRCRVQCEVEATAEHRIVASDRDIVVIAHDSARTVALDVVDEADSSWVLPRKSFRRKITVNSRST